jgi:hypothetical protein
MATKLDETKPAKEEKKAEEKVTTFMPMPFWTQLVSTLDQKTESISKIYGYGKITMEFVVFNGKVKDIVFNDEVRIRPDWSKPPLSDS